MMLDDELYHLIGIAQKLGLSLAEIGRMPRPEFMVWTAFFARKRSERPRG